MARTCRKRVIQPYHLELAIKRVERAPVYKLSRRKKEANEVGFLGEVLFEEFLKKNNIKFSDERISTKHDFIPNQ